MNKKFVTLMSVALLSAVASGVYADEITLGGNVSSREDNTGLVVAEQPTETTETQPSVTEESSSKELGKETEKEHDGDNGGLVVTEQPTETTEIQPSVSEEKPSESLGKESEKNPSQDNTGVIVEPSNSSEKPKEEQPKEEKPKADIQKEDDTKVQEDKKKAEDNVGVKESDVPKPLNVTKEDIQEQPIETNTGHKVVSTNQGKVVVETSEGDYAEKEPYEVGAVKQKDGTIALKDKEGQLKVLPNTGTASTIFTTIWGFVGLIATVIGKRKFD